MSAPSDIRSAVAQYYDLTPHFPNDIPFYRALIPSDAASILELGCGTGRVLLALAPHCSFIFGIDASAAMLAICRQKLASAKLPPGRATVQQGDITRLDLGRTFDLVIAPFRVLQNLETDEQLDRLFAGISRHLAAGGTCVLNVFKPKWPRDEMLRRWITDAETFVWEVPLDGDRVVCVDRRRELKRDPLVLYPELVWRRYRGAELIAEAAMKIPMRCYYPDDFAALIAAHGFRITGRWGGYAGEPYGEGPELLIRFARS